jgi:hypothetical protein
MNLPSFQEVGVAVALISGDDFFGGPSVFGIPLILFILLIIVVDLVVVGVIIDVALKKSQPSTREVEVGEVLRETELTEIRGIGSKRARELNAVGVNTVSDLATASGNDLSQKTGISGKTISRWITEANRT